MKEKTKRDLSYYGNTFLGSIMIGAGMINSAMGIERIIKDIMTQNPTDVYTMGMIGLGAYLASHGASVKKQASIDYQISKEKE